MAEIARIASWNDLIDALFRDAWNPGIHRFRSSFAFRGQSDARLPLETGLARVTAPDTEAHLIRNFRKYAWNHANQGDSIWNWLALGQHHGLPTRLMDWTFSPYVALHFATSQLEWFDVDGIVWAVDFAATNRQLPPDLIEVLDAEGSSVFTVETLERIAPTLADLDALADEPFLAFLEPPSLDDRIVNQAALFSFMSSASAAPTDWLEARPEVARAVVIPAELKWEIRDRLDQANVTERVLFPGLDGLSAWLRRYYWPKG